MPETEVKHNLFVNPFPGLRAFNGSESHLFFGREEHIADVIQKLVSHHFVAVVGTSGTGKSSLIKAGVLPAIESQRNAADARKWEVVTITPGNAPILNLANAIGQNTHLMGAEHSETVVKRLVDLMSNSTLGLVQGMRPLLAKDTRVLLLIDQFEEVFRFADEDSVAAKQEYDQFVNLLIETVRQRDVPIYAILTLRSDFLGDCVAFDGLPEAINDGHYLVPRMNKAQMKRAITGPIDYAGGKISPRLIQHITTDLGSNADQLPILQHAMMRCWDYWKNNEVVGEPMDLKHFEAIGDLDYALSNHANEAFDELTPARQILVEKIFKCLTTKKADNRGVRRPMSLGHLVEITESTKEEILACIAPFQKAGRSFILPGTVIQADDATIFDISHESLMRGWERLKNWVDNEMDSSEFYGRICTAAVLYQKGASALWRNPELQLAIDWKEKQQPIAAWGMLYNENFALGIDFINASQQADIAERKKKSARTRSIRVAVTTIIIVISILAGWALLQTGIANKKTVEAELKSKEALEQKVLAEGAKEEALTASNEAETNRGRAEQHAKIAAEQALIAEQQAKLAKEQRGIAEVERLKAVASAREAQNKQKFADEKSKEAIEQGQKADAARDEALRLRLLATSQNLAHESSQIRRDVELAALLSILSFDIAKSNQGEVNDATLYSASSKAFTQIAKEYSPKVVQFNTKLSAIMVKSSILALVDNVGISYFYDTKNFGLVKKMAPKVKAEDIDQVFVNPLQNNIALGLNAFALYTFGEGVKEKANAGHEGLVRSVAFRNTNPTMISGGRDSKLIFWHNEAMNAEIALDARIKTISALPEGTDCFVGCENGKVYRVNLSDKKQHLFASRPNTRVEVVAESADGVTIAVGYSDGITQVYTKGGTLIKELVGEGSVAFLKIDSKHDLLATASPGNLISLYSLSNLTLLPIEITTNRPIKDIDIDRNSGELYVHCTDNAIYKYATRADWFIEQLRQKVSRKLTQEEWKTFVGRDIPYYKFNPEQIKK